MISAPHAWTTMGMPPTSSSGTVYGEGKGTWSRSGLAFFKAERKWAHHRRTHRNGRHGRTGGTAFERTWIDLSLDGVPERTETLIP